MAGEDLLRIGNYAKARGYGKVYLVLTTHRLLLVGKKSMMDFLLRDITNVGWKKKRLFIQTASSGVTLKGKRKWRRTYDDFLRTVREQQWGFGVGQPAHLPPRGAPIPPPPITSREVITRERVMIKCPYCGGLVEQGTRSCPSCTGQL